ncbi:hypothetical protein KCP69_13610 [Salmonella enterica subsp. enterica]|nr:hypothetical protein KCP69_13610 [Salmonella enterica subsp. enterica]
MPVDALTLMGLIFPLRRCDAGQMGCIENYLSGRGFAWLYQHILVINRRRRRRLSRCSRAMSRRTRMLAIRIYWRFVWGIY